MRQGRREGEYQSSYRLRTSVGGEQMKLHSRMVTMQNDVASARTVSSFKPDFYHPVIYQQFMTYKTPVNSTLACITDLVHFQDKEDFAEDIIKTFFAWLRIWDTKTAATHIQQQFRYLTFSPPHHHQYDPENQLRRHAFPKPLTYKTYFSLSPPEREPHTRQIHDPT